MIKVHALCGAVLAILASASGATELRPNAYEFREALYGKSFQRIATVANYRNNANRADETVSEIVAAN